MRNPTKKQVQKVIDTFEKVRPLADNLHRKNGHSIDMLEGVVKHTCGTPMCHAAWFVALDKKMKDYNDGARKMAKTLGFDNDTMLMKWAFENPEIWGNEFGNAMFCDPEAFGVTRKIDLTMSKIIRHWKGVQKRLPK